MFVIGPQIARSATASGHSKPFTILSNIHPHISTPTAVSTTHGNNSSGAVRVRRLAQGHLNTPLGEAGDRTSNLRVTSQPALPGMWLLLSHMPEPTNRGSSHLPFY